ncbi:hypothetical protein [Methylobacterium nigriterrae]
MEGGLIWLSIIAGIVCLDGLTYGFTAPSKGRQNDALCVATGEHAAT